MHHCGLFSVGREWCIYTTHVYTGVVASEQGGKGLFLPRLHGVVTAMQLTCVQTRQKSGIFGAGWLG